MTGPWRATGAAGGALVASLATAVAVRDPRAPGSFGVCPSKLLTGWDCPGCGTLRACRELLEGNVAAAADFNLLLVLLLAGGTAWLLLAFGLRMVGRRAPTLPRAGQLTLLAVPMVFAALRNTPSSWGVWLLS